MRLNQQVKMVSHDHEVVETETELRFRSGKHVDKHLLHRVGLHQQLFAIRSGGNVVDRAFLGDSGLSHT